MKNAPKDDGESIDMTTRRITMETELAEWIDGESGRLGMTSSAFVTTLLEWARDENFAGDDTLFPGALDYSPVSTPDKQPANARAA